MKRFALLLALSLVCACHGTQPTVVDDTPDGGPACQPGFVSRQGKCCCTNDTVCPSGQYCNSLSGQCQPIPVQSGPDAGTTTCVDGAQRCAPDPGNAVQECKQGAWTDVQECGDDGGIGTCNVSANGYFCTICAPGATRCASPTQEQTCNERGDQWTSQDCPVLADGQAYCNVGACAICNAGQTRCSSDNTYREVCDGSGLTWNRADCPYTDKCDPATNDCVAPMCVPGASLCESDGFTLQTCDADGLGMSAKDCRTLPDASPNAVCLNDACADPCGDATKNASYEGCDYWAAVLSNSGLDPAFKGKAADGTQPTSTSEFALVVSNQNANPVHVKVTRLVNGAEQVSPMSPAPDASGRYTIAPNALATLRLPWQVVSGTGQAPYGYHLTSDLPVSVYQFNPVTSVVGGLLDQTYSYTNDASLLLPTQILSTSYVVVAQEHIATEEPGGSWDPYPALMAVVATADNTKVTIRFSATTLATPSKGGNGSIAAQTIGSTQTYTLNRYDVLQFLSDQDSTTAVECQQTPMYMSSDLSSQIEQACRYKSDPTGSIVTSDKPVAVFGGADCTLMPFDRLACDHTEEEMMPFSTWGKNYVGVRSHAYKDSSGYDVSDSDRSPDYWTIVSGCGKTDCPSGTHVTINPAPTTILEPGKTLYCNASGSDCVLPPVDPTSTLITAPVLEFEHKADFLVTADQPIMLAQYLTSEDANKPADFDPTQPDTSGYASEGDPSLILTAPVEQWRTSYHVLASPTMQDNYLNLAVKNASPTISIDGKDVSKFSSVQKTTVPGGYTCYRVPVGQGAHTITSPDPVGVTVYGYDEYVSYGYTGGLDLTSITTIIPGG